jgi:hypothetical protein
MTNSGLIVFLPLVGCGSDSRTASPSQVQRIQTKYLMVDPCNPL